MMTAAKDTGRPVIDARYANVEIITIGTELLLGSTVDSNSAFIGRSLADIGLDIYAKHSVGDNRDRLARMLDRALEESGGVITTGGLGPTVDDLTKDAIAHALGTDLVLHEPSLRAIEERFARSGRTVGENNTRQALLPRGCTVMENPHGTAPGFIAVRPDGKFIASMPGVPREMRPMLQEILLPWLREHFDLRGGIVTRTLRTVGIAESDVDRRIEHLFRNLENPKIAVLAHAGAVDIKIMAKVADRATAPELIAPVEAEIRAAIGEGIFGMDGETLEAAVLAAARARSLTIGLAESCTGGKIAAALTEIPGSSDVLRGGIVAYANDVKTQQLGVPSDLLARHGAVSRETAIAMAEGARARLNVSVALSVTGIAGPGGGSPEKPVGTVWFGLAVEGRPPEAKLVHVSGDRTDVRVRTTVIALAWLYETLALRK